MFISTCDASRDLIPHAKLKNVNPASLLKVTLLRGCFSRFLNYKYGTKSHKASHVLFI